MNCKQIISLILVSTLIFSVNQLSAQNKKASKANLDAAFNASLHTITAGECIDFTDMSTGGPTYWQWSFPGSQTVSSNAQNPTGICYYYAGVYDVILEVQNGSDIDTEIIEDCITVVENTEIPIADFRADYTTIPVGGVVNFTNLSQNGPFNTYAWTFESGIPNVSNEETPIPIAYTTVGTYRVELRVENTEGVQDDEVKVKYINVIPAATIPPVANFMADRIFIAPGDFINFKDMSAGNPYIWKWFFEGAEPTLANIKDPQSILYTMPGTYDVELIVESNKGIDTIRKIDYIVVAVTDPCVAIPIADFSASQRLIRSGTTIYFEDKSRNNPTTWNWYFQGGYQTYSAVSNVINGVEYNAAGFYDVSLSVNNACGSNYVYKEDYILVFSGPINKYCDTISNINANESINSPNLSGTWGRIGGHNGQKSRIYAEKFDQYSFEQIDGLIIPVTVSEHGSYNSKVTFYVWKGNTTYPEEVLYEKDVFLRNIPSNFYFPIDFQTPIAVEGPFFAGYKINYVDTDGDGISDDEFAVSIAVNRTYASAKNTLFVQTNGVWNTATEKFGVKTSSAIKAVTCLVDLEEFEIDNNIEIYPNPAADYIYINTGNLDCGKDIHLQFIDQTGRIILSYDTKAGYNDISININSYPPGLYFVNMIVGHNKITKKILINR
ncbi:MAG: PKD domain-containing protein [Bacteroidales bacterium]|nr:PKD domain-containing protein [Bacteroidales bacterium]MDD4217029.1 PKD domain-containing protein [Bacteroidales bacterium]MDY0142306.1 PKD domain-containing protein [Bacteroidales bacterium]